MTRDAVSPDTFAAGLSAGRLHCRELGHVWRAWTVTLDRKARCYDRTLRCSSCRTMRHQVLTMDGAVLSNHYAYPAGYLATAVEGHVDRSIFRLESLHRSIAETSPSQLKAV